MKVMRILILLMLSNLILGCNFHDEGLIGAYKSIENYKYVVDVRVYEKRNYERTVIIDIMKLAQNEEAFLEYIYSSFYFFNNGKYEKRATMIENYNNNTHVIYDGNKNIVSKIALAEEDLEANRIDMIEKRKTNIYSEERYLLPFLGVKYLNKLRKLEDSNCYYNNGLLVEGFSSRLFLSKPIVANIEIIGSRIVEKYSDYYANKVTRVLEGINISNSDLSELGNYSNEVLRTINLWLQE